jgi:DNA polymerase sigma
VCTHCNKEGHLLFECPQDQLPKLETLPEMTEKWRKILDNVFKRVYDENRQTKEEEITRSELLREIKRIVSIKYPQAKLSLFGSSNNGFAMKKSDLDICMTLDTQSSTGEVKKRL